MVAINSLLALAAGALIATSAALELSVNTTFAAQLNKPSATYLPALANLTQHSILAQCDPDIATLDCYENVERPCYGVWRGTASAAANWFCGWVNSEQHVFRNPSDKIIGHFSYERSEMGDGDGLGDEGVIYLEITVPDDATCSPPVVMSYHSCVCNLMATIDACDTDSEYGKRGGAATAGCLRYTLQPNPLYWPECDYMDCSVGGAPMFPQNFCTYTHEAAAAKTAPPRASPRAS